MRVDIAQFRALPLDVHTVLWDVPLKDVSAVDLPGGGPGRTLSDVRALIPPGQILRANPAVRALFALRLWLGRVLGWDGPEHDRPEMSYLSRMSEAQRERSVVPPGTMEGGFRLLYLLGQESLAEDPQRDRPRLPVHGAMRAAGRISPLLGRLRQASLLVDAGVHGVHRTVSALRRVPGSAWAHPPRLDRSLPRTLNRRAGEVLARRVSVGRVGIA